MWSEPFTIKQGKEEVAVLLMDTQGALDIQSTVKDCGTVFALSTMLSSVQVYNLSMNILEDDLQHLQSCIAYGRLALEYNNDFKPFQVLQLVVRDWPFLHIYALGDEGGRKILERKLQVFDEQNEELKQLREDIRSCFQRIDCYLMPYPGEEVTENSHFDGRLKDMRPVFQEHLKRFSELLLDPTHLVVKKINGSIVTAKGLLELFKAYMKIFQGDTLPKPMSMLLATAEANNLAAVDEASDLYYNVMESICAPDKPYLKPEDFERAHTRCVENSLDLFNRTPKMGGAEFSKDYEKELKLKLEQLYMNYVRFNDSKTLLSQGKALGIGSAGAGAPVTAPATAGTFAHNAATPATLDPAASLAKQIAVALRFNTVVAATPAPLAAAASQAAVLPEVANAVAPKLRSTAGAECCCS